MTSTLDVKQFQGRLERLDTLLREVGRSADPGILERTRELIQALLDLHGEALEQLMNQVADAGELGQAVLDAWGGDGVIAGLLLLHGLHPLDVEARVRQALDSVRPYLRSHGGNVELLAISDSVVQLRLQGSCHHCPSSAVTMQQTIEEAIYGQAPEIIAVEVEGMPEEAVTAAGARVALPLV